MEHPVVFSRVMNALINNGIIRRSAGNNAQLAFEVSEHEMSYSRKNSSTYHALAEQHEIFGYLLAAFARNPAIKLNLYKEVDGGATLFGTIEDLTLTTETADGQLLRRIYGHVKYTNGNDFLDGALQLIPTINNRPDRTIEVVGITAAATSMLKNHDYSTWFEAEPNAHGNIMVLKNNPVSGSFLYRRFPQHNPIIDEIGKQVLQPTGKQRVLVLYHADSDGRFAGYAAHRALVRESNDSKEVLFFEVQYSQPFPVDINSLTKNDKVYILDFSYKRPILEEVNARVGQLIVLDHHKGAMEELAGLPYAHFDITKSGALLAWEHFFPGQEPPTVCVLVNDRDLWAKQYTESRFLEAYLRMVRIGSDWDQWHELATNEIKLENACLKGESITQVEESMIEKVFKSNIHNLVEFSKDGLSIRTVLYNCPGLMHSEIAEKYYTSLPNIGLTIGWRALADGIIFSLRSPGNIDCATIARGYGGNGHPKAAGFKLPFKEAFALIEAILSKKIAE